jgi:PAS domain S-box-containing protein
MARTGVRYDILHWAERMVSAPGGLLSEGSNYEHDLEEVREREETIRALLENASQGIITVAEDGTIVQVNAMAERLFGYSRAELQQQPLETLLPERYRDGHSALRASYFRELRSRPMGVGLELLARRKDGSTFPVEISLSYVRTRRGVLAVAFVSDITERLRAEEATRESEATVRALLESAAQGIIGVDAQGTVVLANAMAEQLFGYSRDELLHLSVEDLIPERFRGAHAQYRASYFAEPRPRPMGRGLALSALRKDGTEFPVEISLSYVRTRRGILAVSFITDITERRHAEEALIAQAQELARSNADLQQFAHVTSHDLQEPLRMIGSYLQLLSLRYSGRLDKSADQYISFAVEGVQRMQALIDDILSFSRAANVESVPRVPVPFATAVRWATSNLAVSIEESGATVECCNLPVLPANQVQIVQLFQNLIANSIRYARPNTAPVIRVTASQDDGQWLIRVSDNGIGIPPEYQEQVFGLFKRLHRDKQGTGLGLAICRKIVEKHAGRIWIESIPDSGTTVVIALPAQFESDGR